MQTGLLLLAAAVTAALDWMAARRGLVPPGYALRPDEPLANQFGAVMRRGIALTAIALVLWIGVLGPIATIGQSMPENFKQLPTSQLFLLHALFLFTLAIWFIAGFIPAVGPDPRDWWRVWKSQLGWRSRRPLQELVLGVGAGVVSWFGVILLVSLVALIVYALGGEDWLPQSPPPILGWIVGLPFAVRLGLALSAGLVEETFFRGFLQPRTGILLSSTLFILAHLSYGQPFMLVGVALLSFIFAGLVRWRQSVWAAVAAHATFDGLQLLVIMPTLARWHVWQGIGGGLLAAGSGFGATLLIPGLFC
jgi:membrane protease YdiL (CAAX protease family)